MPASTPARFFLLLLIAVPSVALGVADDGPDHDAPNDSFEDTPVERSEEPGGRLEDVVELPSFIVGEEGLDAQFSRRDTDTGKRLRMDDSRLPLHYDLVNTDFIRDTGSLDLPDALRYTAGLETDLTLIQAGDNTAMATDTGFRLRGFVQDSVMRNGFRMSGEVDLFNVTQVEVLRGPNGLLYGANTTGGTVVYHTRRPTDHYRFSADFAAGSNDFKRITATASGPVNENIRFAVSALFADTEAWYDRFEEERTGFAPVVEWTPFRDTTILIEGEILQREGNNPSNDPFEFTLQPFQGDLLQPGFPPVRVPYVRTGEVFSGVGFFDYPGGQRWEASNDFDHEDSNIHVSLNQKIGDDLEVEFGYFGSKRERNQQFATLDITNLDQVSDNLGLFLNLLREYPWLTDPSTPEFQATNEDFGNLLLYNWEKDEFRETRHQFRLETSYHLPVSDMWTNDFLFGATYMETEVEAGGSELVTLNPDFGPGQQLSERFDTPIPRLRPLSDRSPIQFDPRPGEFYVGGLGDPTKLIERGAYVVHSGTYWDKRIRSVTGLRYDQFSVKRTPRRSDITGEVVTVRFREDTPSTTNASFGLSASPHRNSPWSVYLLTASSVESTFGRYDAAGNRIAPPESRSYEAGLKFDFLNGKLSGTASVYKIEREDVPVGSQFITFAERGDPGFNPNAGRTALRDDESRGVDLSAVITDLPLKNLQTVLGFSYVDYEITGLDGTTYNGPDSGTFQNVDIPYDRTITNNGTPEYSFRAWTKYTFREGPLRGLDLALGFRWTDEREATLSSFPDRSSFTVIDSFEEWEAAVGCNRNFGEARFRVQLNIFNLTDEDGFYGYAYRDPQGRETRVTVSLQF